MKRLLWLLRIKYRTNCFRLKYWYKWHFPKCEKCYDRGIYAVVNAETRDGHPVDWKDYKKKAQPEAIWCNCKNGESLKEYFNWK